MKQIIYLLLTYFILQPVFAQQLSPQEQKGKVTKLKFYVEQSVEQQKDFVELSLIVRDQETSLTKAMKDAKTMLDEIRKMSSQYCKSEGGEQCEDIVEVDNYDVEFKYQLIKRQPNFVGFIVSHQVKITIINTQNIGLLVDKFEALGVYKIKSLQWQPFTELDAQEKAIDTGKQQGKDLCGHLNKKMGDVLQIEEIIIQNEKDEGEEDEDQEEEDQEKPSILLFEVECIENTQQDKRVKPKKKKK